MNDDNFKYKIIFIITRKIIIIQYVIRLNTLANTKYNYKYF